jgi:protein-tyrosine-phosphatase
MAEGFVKALGGLKLEAYSAGSNPGGKVNPDAVKVMREIGIDISTAKSKGFNDLAAKEFDYVVTMGCQDICPFVPAKKHIDWEIEDPKGKGEEFFRKTRDQIKEKIESLIREV